MSLGRFSQSLDKARQDKKLNRSRLVASACRLGATLSAAGCASNDSPMATAVNGVGPPPPDVREAPHYGGGSGGGGGGGTT